MFKSIYKKITEDFAFLCNYGYSFIYNLKHNVSPSVMYKNDEVKLQIGYCYEDHRMYVNLYNTAKKRKLSKETLEKIETIDPKMTNHYKDGIECAEDVLKGLSLIGNSYGDQVEQVKDYLQKVLRESGS